MILVTGATGTVGREVVAQLLVAGEKVRALSRDLSKAQFDDGVQLVAGDLTKPETLPAALAGVDRVFSLAVGPQIGAQEGNLAQASKKAGVRRIVNISVLGAGDSGRGGIAEWHSAGERAIQNSGIPWTFVRPGAFMSNALFWRGSIKSFGKVFSNYGDGKTTPIHPRDIAAVAVRALTAPGHEEKAYPLTGPQAITVAEQVTILSDAIGKPIQYVSITDEVAREQMQKAGVPTPYIDALLPFGAHVRAGGAARVLDTVRQITSKQPLTFADWAREHADAFR
jgi:(4-alkanoyl-5-oxo-2,5-dihydrofuran-3-yl)methyl phosphate reductase